MNQTNSDMMQCIKNCQDCHNVCLQTTSYCLSMGGKHAETNHIQLLMDCADICQTSANFMVHQSPFHTRTCAVCAEVCERCAQDCRRIDASDTQMKACADICSRCADSCRRMSTAMAA